MSVQFPVSEKKQSGGVMRTSRVLDYMPHLSLMGRMGVRLDRFGDTGQRLTNLWSDEA